MFIDAQTFNSNISGWNMENVTLMSYMFDGAASFNDDISNWNVSNVINMDNMFHNASMFNQDLSNWCVFNIGIEPYQFSVGSPLTSEHKPVWGDCPEDGAFKFYYIDNGAASAAITDFPVGTIVEWPNGNTNTFNNVGDIFINPASTEGVVKVFINNSMPYGERNFIGGRGVTKLLSWGNYQGSKLETSGKPFGFISFDSKLVNVPSNLPPSITDLSNFFKGSKLFNDPNVMQWDVSNVTNMSGLFNDASIFDQDISGWDVSNVTNMDNMFRDAQSFNQDLSGWCVANITMEPTNFSNGSVLTPENKPVWGDCPANNPLRFKNNSTGVLTVSGFPNGSIISFIDGTTVNLEDNSIAYNITLDSFKVGDARIFIEDTNPYGSNVMLTCDELLDWGSFAGNRLTFGGNIINVPNYLPSTITSLSSMFQFSLFNGDISGWDTTNVTDMSSMFVDAALFNQDISSWNVGNVTNMSYMFNGAIAFNQNLTNWDTSNVINMAFMFRDASSFNGDISGWDTQNVTDMPFMFYFAVNFNGDISGWNTSSLTDSGGMFLHAHAFNQNIGGWDVSNITNMDNMFNYAEEFNQDLSGWCVTNITSEPPR